MTTITNQDAQSNLADVIRRLQPGEEVSITDNDKTVATLAAAPLQLPPRERKLGTMRGDSVVDGAFRRSAGVGKVPSTTTKQL